MPPVAAWNAREVDEAQLAWRLPKTGLDSTTPLKESSRVGNGTSSGFLGGPRSVKRIGANGAPWPEADDSDARETTVLNLPVADGGLTVAPPRRFPASLTALRSLRTDDSTARWSETAVILKRDAVRLRHTHYGRHASILLALADALTFTEPTDPTLDSQARSALDQSLSVLTEPHVAEAAEEALLVSLLSHGWNLTPSVPEDELPAA